MPNRRRLGRGVRSWSRSVVRSADRDNAYKFIRESGYLIMPHPDTLKKICNNLNVSSQVELLDENFLMYISSRVKYFDANDKTNSSEIRKENTM